MNHYLRKSFTIIENAFTVQIFTNTFVLTFSGKSCGFTEKKNMRNSYYQLTFSYQVSTYETV